MGVEIGLREAISEETNQKLRLSTEVQAATASILPQSGVSGVALLVSPKVLNIVLN